MPKTLLQKLADIRSKVSVEKLGYNDYHKYYYVREEDAIKAVRAELITEKILISPNYEYLGRQGDIVTVNGLFEFENLEEPFDKKTYKIPAEGQDKGDKAIYKAETGALKQCLIKVFLLSSGDDPEYEGGESTKRTSKASASTPKSEEAAKESTTGTQKPSPEPPSQIPRAQIPPFDAGGPPNIVSTKEERNKYLKSLAEKLGPAKTKALGEWIRSKVGKDLRAVSNEQWQPVLATLREAEASNGLDKLLEVK